MCHLKKDMPPYEREQFLEVALNGRAYSPLLLLLTLVAGPRRSWSLKLSAYEPQIATTPDPTSPGSDKFQST